MAGAADVLAQTAHGTAAGKGDGKNPGGNKEEEALVFHKDKVVETDDRSFVRSVKKAGKVAPRQFLGNIAGFCHVYIQT